jgi:hypothetical protein
MYEKDTHTLKDMVQTREKHRTTDTSQSSVKASEGQIDIQ